LVIGPVPLRTSGRSDSSSRGQLRYGCPGDLANLTITIMLTGAIMRLVLGFMLYTKVGPIETWAYNTSANDMNLRDALYEEFGVKNALNFLAKRFPRGSCREFLEQMRNTMGAADRDDKGITEALLRQLRSQMSEYRTLGRSGHSPRPSSSNWGVPASPYGC
jgi:hypothetical protein